MTNCYDVIPPVHEAVRNTLPATDAYHVLGGIGSSALAHKGTVIDASARSVTPHRDAAPTLLRPNGTRRDIDILVDTILSDEAAEAIKADVASAIGEQLVVSVFGFDRKDELALPTWSQRLKHAAGDWISSRTLDSAGNPYYELFPLNRQVDPASYEPWKLVLPSGHTVDMLHPAGHTLAYRMRSISGIRGKDAEKLRAMERNVLPHFEEEIHDGPFKEWKAFADDIRTLLENGVVDKDGLRFGTGVVDRKLFMAKGRSLRAVESSEHIVNFAQGDLMQRLLNVFVHAK